MFDSLFLMFARPRWFFVIVRSHIGSEHPESEPFKYMFTLTSKTRFETMRGCQEQTCEEDLDIGGLGGPKRTISY
jgi:hypothetical protein